MKRILPHHLRFGITLAALALLGACSEKPSPGPRSGLSWTVDGSDMKAQIVCDPSSPTAIQLGGYMSFTSPTGNGSTQIISLLMPRKTGTYTLRGNNGAAQASYSGGSSGALYLDTSGTITVTSLTANSIAGTFAFQVANPFKAGDTKALTNGQFYASF